MTVVAVLARWWRRGSGIAALLVLTLGCLVLLAEQPPVSAQQGLEVAPPAAAAFTDAAPAPPFGSLILPFGLKGTQVHQIGVKPFTAAHVRASHSVEKLRDAMAMARRHKVKLFIRLTGSKERFQNKDGSFSLKLWKQDLDLLRRFDFAPYVADGTVVGAELINEPHDPNNWGRTIVSKEDLEAAAAYAKSIWPTLPVGAGRSDYLLQLAPWQHLDFSHSQYARRKGDVEAWLDRTVAESKAAGVALILSLNFAGDGNGNRAPMTAKELLEAGSVLARETYACMLTGYMYDPTYLAQPGVMEAFSEIAAIAAAHPAPPCYVGSKVKP